MKFYPILRENSRSFYLSICWLPSAVRDSIALGYLLARASDSIADASSAPLDRRVEALHALRDAEIGPRITEELAGHQPKLSEAKLVRALPDLLDILEKSPDCDAIIHVWSKILEGQIFDLIRFHNNPSPLSPDELDEYTYLVAGSVGEFWSNLCHSRLAGFSKISSDAHVQLAISYGKGLQRVNILRDTQADRALGRHYLAPGRFEIERMTARTQLNDGLHWVQGVESGRVRLSGMLPARIGLEMLDQLDESAGPLKLSRRSIRRHLIASLPLLWSASKPINPEKPNNQQF